MRSLFIDNSLGLIRRHYPDYSEEKIEEIEYGLLSIYITITKLAVIAVVAIILGAVKECFLFILFYNFIRTTSFGLHATKSWACMISSIIIFIGGPIICMNIELSMNLILILGVINVLLIYKNSPADTYNRPIISSKRRSTFKLLSTIIATAMVIAALIVNSVFIANTLIIVLAVQNFLISPFGYRIFNLPYDNYKNYI